jgi:hypothetical protein
MILLGLAGPFAVPAALGSAVGLVGGFTAGMARPPSPAVNLRAHRGMRVDIRVEGVDQTQAEFRQARREFNARLRSANQRAGTRVLPEITRDMGAYGDFARLYVRRERSGVELGSRQRGSLNRAVGWLDFGGKRPQDSGRREGPYAIVRALDRHRDSIERAQLDEILKAFSPLDTDGSYGF